MDRIPEMQWQAARRYGWVDLDYHMSNKLELGYCNGEAVLNMWCGGSFCEFDLRNMLQMPGGIKLRRVKWAERPPMPPPLVDAVLVAAKAKTVDDDKVAFSVHDVMRLRNPDPITLNKLDAAASAEAEKARARWGPKKPKTPEKKLERKSTVVKSAPVLPPIGKNFKGIKADY